MQSSLKQLVVSVSVLGALASGVVACNQQNFDKPAEQAQYGQKVTYNTDVDVLFVVDTSGAMSKHQRALASQMGSLIEAFNRTGLNYQFAVTTMDMSSGGERGRFRAEQGEPTVLKADTPNLVSLLAERIEAGEYDWQPLARAFEATRAALTGPLAEKDNAGFLRPNALLAVIYLSNEDDDSANEDWKKFFDQLRPALKYGGRSWVVQYMGVTTADPSCKSSAWGYYEPGLRFMDLAKTSGGAAVSICNGDMRAALSNVKARILEMMTEYVLPAKPVVDSIKVYVNNQLIPKSETDGWTYDATKNSVIFHGTAIPAQDSVIKVDFDRDGLS